MRYDYLCLYKIGFRVCCARDNFSCLYNIHYNWHNFLCLYKNHYARTNFGASTKIMIWSFFVFCDLTSIHVEIIISLFPNNIVVTPALCRCCHLPIGFCFTRFIPSILDFRQKNEGSYPFLRVPRFGLLCPTFLQRLFQSCWQIFSHWKFMRDLLRFYLWYIFSAVSALVSGLLISSALIWWVSSGSFLSQKVSYFLGALKSS